MNLTFNKLSFINNIYVKKNQNNLILTSGSNLFTYLNNLKSKNLFLDIVGVDSHKKFFSIVFRDNVSYSLQLWFFTTNKSYTVFNNWMFREYNEFFSTIFHTSSDNRNLLLDYNVLYKPLKKNFPTIGFEEVYYNFSNGFISYVKLNSIEL